MSEVNVMSPVNALTVRQSSVVAGTEGGDVVCGDIRNLTYALFLFNLSLRVFRVLRLTETKNGREQAFTGIQLDSDVRSLCFAAHSSHVWIGTGT